jgi:hypothetical protein
MEQPSLITGGSFTDARGTLYYNNAFDAFSIKRMYILDNSNIDIVRGWQGHKIEQRWFIVANGYFEIQLIAVDNWESPSKELESIEYQLSSETMDVLHVPAGYISAIKSMELGSKLLALSDYELGDIVDEFRFDIDYFIIK